jgi:hypothetical protein
VGGVCGEDVDVCSGGFVGRAFSSLSSLSKRFEQVGGVDGQC